MRASRRNAEGWPGISGRRYNLGVGMLICLFALLVYIPPAAGCEDPEPQKLHLVASPLGAQPQSDRILRVLCGRLVPGAHFMPRLDALKRACRRSSLQASRSARTRCAIGVLRAVLRKHTPGSGAGACLWSKRRNACESGGLVPDPIAMAHAFAELG